MLDDFARDLLHAARLLRRNPAFSTVVIATLAIAIGAALTVFSIVDAWLVRPLSFPRADRLVIAFAARPERPTEPAVWLPYRAFLGWHDRSRSFASLAAAFPHDVTLTTASEARSILGLIVSPEFFRTFGVGPLVGRTLSESDATGPPGIVLSYGLWQRQFGGSANVVGTLVTLSGVPHQVVGVMPRDFDTRVLDMRFEFWTLLKTGEAGYGPAGAGPVALIGRLRNGVPIDVAQSEVASITRESESRYPVNFNRFVVALASLQADNTRTVHATLLTVSAAVASLLLIAAMNVGSLLLGRGLGRMREAAIRIAIGSGRARLVRQFLTESVLIALVGSIVGLALAAVAIRLFAVWHPLGALPANAIRLDLRVLAAAGVAMAVTTMVCGLMPALRVSDADPQDALRSGGERGPAVAPAHRAQAMMLVAQMAGCVVMLVATTLLVRTFMRLQAEPLGFDAHNVSVANLILPNDPFDTSEKRNIFYRQAAARIRAIAGVRSVAAATSAPLNSGAPVTVNVGAQNSPDAPRISAQEVTTEFFDTAGGAPVAILNARAARELFGGSTAAIGQHVRFDKEPVREVVGVVGGVRSTFFNTLEWKADPIVYKPADQAFSTFSNPTATSFGFKLHIRADRQIPIGAVRDAVIAVSPHAALTELRTVSDMIGEATRQPAFRMTLLFWFAAASVLLAGIGVYGLVSQAVTQRIRELAIRSALGAGPAQLVAAIVFRALATAAAGLVIGGVGALTLGRTLEAVLYGVRPRDVLSFISAGAVLLAVTAIAALVPALRATRVDPATVLRAD
jgi:putative ABC transport system permease protein